MTLPPLLQFGKSGITPFTGQPNRLQPFLQDIELNCTAQDVNEDSPLLALAIFQHCTEQVKSVLRNMDKADLLQPNKVVTVLKQSFGFRSLIKVA